jgi:hypothetical protein
MRRKSKKSAPINQPIIKAQSEGEMPSMNNTLYSKVENKAKINYPKQKKPRFRKIFTTPG